MTSPTLIQNPLIPSTQSGSLNTNTPTTSFQIDLRNFRSSAGNFSLTDLSGDADLRVFREPAMTDGTRVLVGESRNQGKLSESLLLGTGALTPGVYTIEVSLAQDAPTANYKLNVAVNTDASLSNIFWRNAPGAQSAVWRMDGTTVAGATSQEDVASDWQVQGIADLDGDGEEDLLWRNGQGQVAFWTFKGGEVANAGFSANLSIGPEWQITAVKDLSGDGQADLVWQNTSQGQVAVWQLKGGVSVNGNLVNVGPGWRTVAAVDLDADTRSDIILQNLSTGDFAFWLMNGAEIRRGALIKIAPSWQPQLYGDFNSDGKTDIVLRDRSTGTAAIWLMDGTSISHGWMTAAISLDWQIEALGNFDGRTNSGNGNKDLLWRNRRTGEMAIWLMNPDGKSFSSQQFVQFNGSNYNNGAGWTIAGIGDFNYDSKEDIIYRNDQQGGIEILLMNGTNISTRNAPASTIGSPWRVQGIMQRKIQAQPFEISGRSQSGGYVAATAFNLGLLDGSATYRDRVQFNAADYFRFNVSTQSNVTLNATGTGVTLELFPILQNGTLGSAIAATPDMLLNGGAYAVKVSTTRTDLAPDYTLSVTGKPKTTDVAGVSFSLLDAALALNPTPEPGSGQVFEKNRLTARFKVRNNSSLAINNLEVGFRISRDGRIDTTTTADAQLEIGGTTGSTLPVYTIASLAAGATSAEIEVQLVLPDTAADFWFVDGQYTIGMVVDPNNKLTEDNESNNFNVALNTDKGQLAVTRTETIELVGSDMRVTSGTFAPDQTLRVSFTLQNLGNRAFPSDTALPLQFYLSSDTTLDQTTDIPLEVWAAGTTSGNFNQFFVDAPASGTILGAKGSGSDTRMLDLNLKLPPETSLARGQTYYLSVWIDPAENTAKEADFTNNRIDPSKADTPEDTIGKNYIKFTYN
ncbi:FG-GAP-like repeat-containing protein [Leptolyngbya sp. DQ-M1]|uniref:FG-GAP-like repeat-containing protein n=1 Tax=Leptolyngbya sp. DQ-M1 TaxID=2933920 RepID=UPI0032979FAD